MAKDLALDLSTMDLKWPFQFVTGKNELIQSLDIGLMTPKGSLLDAPEQGLDTSYLKHFNPDELRLAINNCLKQDKRVTGVNKINMKLSKDHTQLNIFIDVSTTLGEINFTKEMNMNASN